VSARDEWSASVVERHPAFATLARAFAPFREHRDWPTIDEWNAHVPATLTSVAGAPIKFIPQPAKKKGALPYDERIFTRGEVPSRPHNWHDFFNMLVWLTFPRTKRAINSRQRALLRPGAPARTPEQDALAMLDEGGAVVVTSDSIEDVVHRGDADALGEHVRRGSARVVILGHAIYEHLVVGSGVVRAFVQVVRDDVDVELARALELAAPRPDKSRVPLPIVDALFPAR